MSGGAWGLVALLGLWTLSDIASELRRIRRRIEGEQATGFRWQRSRVAAGDGEKP